MLSEALQWNRLAAAPENQPSRILQLLAVAPGSTVADIGAGGGYFSLRFSEIVGRDGVVYAVDVEPLLLHYIEVTARTRGIENVRPVLASGGDARLPERAVDLIFRRNVFHYIDNPVAYFRKLRTALSPGGRLAIIDHRASPARLTTGHYTAPEVIASTVGLAGYEVLETHNVSQTSSFTIFRARDAD